MAPGYPHNTSQVLPELSRREFLVAGSAGVAAAALAAAGWSGAPRRTFAQGVSRVAWVRDDRAALGWSSDFSLRVDPAVADAMMDQAVQLLTGQSTVAAAWAQIFQEHNGGAGYQPGQTIAIKVNYNNSSDNMQHNPNFQVLNALLRQLIEEVGIAPGDLILYDSSRTFHRQFSDGVAARFPGVQNNPGSATQYNQSVWNTRLTRLLEDVTYLINMPILRTHGAAGVSLSFKNHLGSVETPHVLHAGLEGATPENSSLVTLNRHHLIRSKTLLVVADAIYGLRVGGPDANPGSAGNGILNPYPNSLFLSRDPVAVDSVMIDYLASRGAVFQRFGSHFEPRTYLIAAASIGLGTHEASPDFNYQSISLATCINGQCSGAIVALPPDSPAPTDEPGSDPTDEPALTATPVATMAAGCHLPSYDEEQQIVVCTSG